MEYSFNVSVAEKCGLEEAILLKNIIFWCNQNAANERHFHDGMYWTYNSAKAFSELFPFWNRVKIQRLLDSLKEKGLIVVGNYNEAKYDRTLWYSVTETALSMHQMCNIHCSKMNNALLNSEQPIPDSKPDSKPDRKQSKPKPTKNKYGSFENVLLTDQELVKLYERFGESEAKHRIEKLSLAIESKGYKYSSHYATILQWAMKESDSPVSIQEKPSNKIPNLWEQKL